MSKFDRALNDATVVPFPAAATEAVADENVASIIEVLQDQLKLARERAHALNLERDLLELRLKTARRAAQAAHERVVDLEQSTSWRVTAPLRRLRGAQAGADQP